VVASGVNLVDADLVARVHDMSLALPVVGLFFDAGRVVQLSGPAERTFPETFRQFALQFLIFRFLLELILLLA